MSKYNSMWWWRYQMAKELINEWAFALLAPIALFAGLYLWSERIFWMVTAAGALLAKPTLFWLIKSNRNNSDRSK